MAVASPLPLHGPRAERTPDWTVSVGPPVEVDGPAEGELIADYAAGEHAYWATRPARGTWVLRHRGAAETILDIPSRTIELRRDPRPAADLSPILLAGSGMAHALAADSIGCLHASAVEVDGRAIAFAAPSGRGKSTLAGLLCRAGARLISDDLLRCEAEGGELICFRGANRLRLRSQAAGLAETLTDSSPTNDGRVSAGARLTEHDRVPVAVVIVPEPSRGTDRVEMRRLRGREAAGKLLRSMRLIGWRDPALAGLNLDLCETILAGTTVVAASIPWGPPFPASLAEEIAAAIGAPA